MPPTGKEHPRFVSLVPSWTETLFSFGFDAEVGGVTKWCVHPKELVARVEKVGGTKDPDVARIVALKPDLVVANVEENRKEDVEALRAAGVNVWASDVRSVDDSLREVAKLGELTGRPEAGEALARRIEKSRREVAAARAGEVLVYVPIWRRPWMTLTRDTYAHDVLALAGARNVFGDAEGRYPEAGPEEALARGATAALLPTEPYPFHTKDVALDELAAAGFARDRLLLVDGEALTWYGAREVEGLRAVAVTVRRLPFS
jgi:ABC-type Fe3+-hydroxamate transport system substrate-binding protein